MNTPASMARPGVTMRVRLAASSSRRPSERLRHLIEDRISAAAAELGLQPSMRLSLDFQRMEAGGAIGLRLPEGWSTARAAGERPSVAELGDAAEKLVHAHRDEVLRASMEEELSRRTPATVGFRAKVVDLARHNENATRLVRRALGTRLVEHPELMREALASTVRRGVAATHVWDELQAIDGSGDRATVKAYELAERAMAQQPVRLGVAVAPGAGAVVGTILPWPRPDRLGSTFCQGLWAELGVIVDEVVVGADPGLAPGEATVRINDSHIHHAAPPHALAELVLADARAAAGSLINADIVGFMLERLRETFPDTVGAALARFDVLVITATLRNFLDWGFTMRDLRRVLAAMLDAAALDGHARRRWAPRELARAALDELGVSRVRLHAVDGVVSAYELRTATNGDGSALADALAVAESRRDPRVRPVLLAPAGERARLRECVRAQFPDLPVLARDDIPAGVRVDVLERFTV